MAKTMCECSPWYFLLGVAFFAAGFWTLVQGFRMQWGTATPTQIYPWYFLGFLLVGMGKLLKRHYCIGCPVHGKR